MQLSAPSKAESSKLRPAAAAAAAEEEEEETAEKAGQT